LPDLRRLERRAAALGDKRTGAGMADGSLEMEVLGRLMRIM
jgi:hypothetical protein